MIFSTELKGYKNLKTLILFDFMVVESIGTELPSGIEKAIRKSLVLDEEVVVSRSSRLIDLDSSLGSLDIIDILFKVGVNPQNYCHGELLDKKLLRYAVECERTELTSDEKSRLYDESICLTPMDIIPYITAGHIMRVKEYDELTTRH